MPDKKRMNYVCVFLLFSLSIPTLATASESSPAAISHRQITQSLPVPQATDTIMPQVAPLFIEDSQRTSLITMVNSAPDEVDVDVILYKLSGEEVARQTVSMSPFSQRTLRISELLEDATVSYGSVFLVPNRKSTMAAQLSITSKAEGPALDIEEEFQMPAGSTPADYRAASVSAQPIIAVRSLSANSETLSVSCLGNDGSDPNVDTPQLVGAVSGLAPAHGEWLIGIMFWFGGPDAVQYFWRVSVT